MFSKLADANPALYNTAAAPKLRRMSFDNPILLGVISLMVLGGITGVVAHFFSPEAKLERRRRRNNYRVVTKARRPMVRLNVRSKKP